MNATIPSTAHPCDLSHIDVFRGIPCDAMSRIKSGLSPVTLTTGTPLLTAGAIEPAVYFLLSGTICIYRAQPDGSRFILNIVGTGEMLGEVCALDQQGHSASACATEPCTLLRMARRDFCRLEQELPSLSHNLKLLLTRRLRFATAHSEALVPHEASRRVARLLTAFAERYSTNSCQAEVLIPLRLTQGDLGGLCALSRQCIWGCWKELLAAGLITSQPRYRLKIVDRLSLHKHC